MKRFRSGTIVSWPHRCLTHYGIVQHFNRTRYEVVCLVGNTAVGQSWTLAPRWLTYIAPAKMPDEVRVALAARALTGKVVTDGKPE